jgi:hypothetical protein
MRGNPEFPVESIRSGSLRWHREDGGWEKEDGKWKRENDKRLNNC